MNSEFQSNPRLKSLLDALLESVVLADAAKPLPISDQHDEIDSIAYAFNVLLGELRFANLYRQRIEADAERQKSESLRSAKDEAERANRAKSAFLRNISHELRTPLTVLLSSTDLLTKPSLSDLHRRESIDRILRSGSVLLGLIDNVLDLSKIEAGRLSFEKIDFQIFELLGDIQKSFAAQAEQKGLRLEIVNRIVISSVCSDARRIRQVLFNLIGNAIKYTQRGTVCLEADLEGTGLETRLIFSVTDTGTGISTAERDQLFQPFGRAKETAAQEGTGLGLHLSRKIAMGLGGSLELADSEPNRGSRFELIVPVGISETTVPVVLRTPAQEIPLKGLRVLIADDNQDIRGVLRALLEIEGATIEEAADGLEAVHKAEESIFDIILMDVRMPNMTGPEAVMQLRAKNYGGVIIALTADTIREMRADCLAAGFNDYVSKPVEIEVLTALIHKYNDRNRTTG